MICARAFREDVKEYYQGGEAGNDLVKPTPGQRPAVVDRLLGDLDMLHQHLSTQEVRCHLDTSEHRVARRERVWFLSFKA